MEVLTIRTNQKRQLADVTNDIAKLVPSSGSGVIHMLVRHTTCALTTADLDPGTDLDLLDFLTAIVPDIQWRHPHNPAHASAHLLTSLIGASLSVPYTDGLLQGGTWQRIVLVELDGPRNRELVVTITKEDT